MADKSSMTIVLVRRALRFSPNSEEKDWLILQQAGKETAELLGEGRAVDVVAMDEETLHHAATVHSLPCHNALYLSMARSDDALDVLTALEQQGAWVVNAARGVRACQRDRLDELMRHHHIAMPPLTGNDGYWLKRGDASAQSKDDIRFCHDSTELHEAQQAFAQRGINSQVVSAHVVGDLVKFYGVDGTSMFRYFYPGDDGLTKFGDEERNGKPHHYVFSDKQLHNEANRLAQLTGIMVYGGDAIVDAEGHFYIIDFNDWPSFSRCRNEAAEAIAQAVKGHIINTL